MMVRVAIRNVMRHRLRTAFTVLALSIAVALLADMLMLSRGMEKTFYRVLSSVGYEVRVCPRGTLPFATDAVIEESSRVMETLAKDGRFERSLRVLGTTLYADSLPLVVMGVDGERQSLYRVIEGHDLNMSGRAGPVREQPPSGSPFARPHSVARPRGAAPLAATRAESPLARTSIFRTGARWRVLVPRRRSPDPWRS